MAVVEVPRAREVYKRLDEARAFLAERNVELQRWDPGERPRSDASSEESLLAYRGWLRPYMRSRGYVSADVVTLHPSMRAKVSVAATEVGELDDHEHAELAFAVVSNDARHANGMLDTIAAFSEKNTGAQLASTHVELVPMGKRVGDPMRELDSLPESWRGAPEDRGRPVRPPSSPANRVPVIGSRPSPPAARHAGARKG
jgi:uncharacterized protein YlxP (DUF503 family)